MRFLIDRARSPGTLFVVGLVVVALTAVTVPAGAADWIELFNGEDLDGWVVRDGQAIWEVVDGTIVGRIEGERLPETSFLSTETEYDDFELEFETKLTSGNSGVQVRARILTEAGQEFIRANNEAAAQSGGGPGGPAGARGAQSGPEGEPAQGARGQPPAEAGQGRGGRGGPGGGMRFPNGRVWGPQVEIAPAREDGTSQSGYIFGEAMGGMWRTPSDMMTPHAAFNNDEWNRYRVVARGARIQTWINDELVNDYADEFGYESHPSGFFGLQVHAGNDCEVAFRNIRVRPLD